MDKRNDLERIMNVLLNIKKINDEIRIELEERMFDLTTMIKMKEVKH